jgi:DNA-binding transcriptional LysR family regulator
VIWAFAALLLLQPVVEEAGTLRLVASGPTQPVTWLVDGAQAGTTLQRVPLEVQVGLGAHVVVAQTTHKGAWQVVARMEVAGPGIAYAPAWTAASSGDGPKVIPGPAAGVLAIAVVAAAWMQSKRP